MKLLIDVEKDYYEMIKYNVEHGQEYKPFEIIANGIPYEERPQGEWILMYCSCGDRYYSCSICNRVIEVENGQSLKDYPFCHCGAEMKGGAE